jgi:DNA-binding GntR family transcriptional regulator
MRTLEAFAVEKADEENDEAIDRELERVHQKVQQLQKEKDILANQCNTQKFHHNKILLTTWFSFIF